jgi:hypothetical protein
MLNSSRFRNLLVVLLATTNLGLPFGLLHREAQHDDLGTEPRRLADCCETVLGRLAVNLWATGVSTNAVSIVRDPVDVSSHGNSPSEEFGPASHCHDAMSQSGSLCSSRC